MTQAEAAKIPVSGNIVIHWRPATRKPRYRFII